MRLRALVSPGSDVPPQLRGETSPSHPVSVSPAPSKSRLRSAPSNSSLSARSSITLHPTAASPSPSLTSSTDSAADDTNTDESTSSRSSSSSAPDVKHPSLATPWATSKSPSANITQDIPDLDTYLQSCQQKMQQTSSKLLRMTEDDRPFTKDFNDLFSTLMVSLPLTPHRVRFSRIEHTFTTEEAISNLRSLKFSQSNRMPDPKDQTRIVTTTTTITFSMSSDMARSVCARFLEARFVESLDSKTDFASKNNVWQLTPKGMFVLAQFCARNGINQRHVNDLLDSPRNQLQLVIFERDPSSDKISHERATVELIFRRFAGVEGPNLRNGAISDTDSMSDYYMGSSGVRMHRSRRTEKESQYVFSGKATFDWIMDCCSVVDHREVYEIANLFLQHGLVEVVSDERHVEPVASNSNLQAHKQVLYSLTSKGVYVAGWSLSPNGSIAGDLANNSCSLAGLVKDSYSNRMLVIIHDPTLRLLFREYLRETHCEENLAFYVEVHAFLADFDRAKNAPPSPNQDAVRETLAAAYSLYNAFLAPGSPCELNIDHALRNALANRMTRAIGKGDKIVSCIEEVAYLFNKAQSSVFKLMASDSVPKFCREPRYAAVLAERIPDANASLVDSASMTTTVV